MENVKSDAPGWLCRWFCERLCRRPGREILLLGKSTQVHFGLRECRRGCSQTQIIVPTIDMSLRKSHTLTSRSAQRPDREGLSISPSWSLIRKLGVVVYLTLMWCHWFDAISFDLIWLIWVELIWLNWFDVIWFNVVDWLSYWFWSDWMT